MSNKNLIYIEGLLWDLWDKPFSPEIFEKLDKCINMEGGEFYLLKQYIEKLESRLAELENRIEHGQKKVVELVARNEELREALESIAFHEYKDMSTNMMMWTNSEMREVILNDTRIAREALKEIGGDDD